MLHLSDFKISGTKVYCLLTADTQSELERASRRLGVGIHGKGWQQPHLDLDPRKAGIALTMGAVPCPSFNYDFVQ